MLKKGAPGSPDSNFSSVLREQAIHGAQVIRSGGTVAFPTDTVYGLGADVYQNTAVSKVFSAKSRPLTLPIPVLISERESVRELVADLPAAAIMLMDTFWPGGLTIIFKCKPSFNSLALAGSDRIGIRLPGHALTIELIRQAGTPITGTSANLHGRPAALTAAEVRSQMGTNVDFIIEGDACPGGIESTIIDVTVNPPVVVREGIIPLEDINSTLKTGGK